MTVKTVKTSSNENWINTPVKTTSGYYSLTIKSQTDPDVEITIPHGEEFDDLFEVAMAVRRLNIQQAESNGTIPPKAKRETKPSLDGDLEPESPEAITEEVPEPTPVKVPLVKGK